jgi:FimV-like protein
MAKSLLNEVSQQGNDAQKKEAEELLKRASA